MKRNRLAAVLILPVLLFAATPADAQKTKKKDDKSAETQAPAGNMAMPDSQAIDIAISEMLAGWQLGDLELMHKHYADNVVVISGAWEPAAVGWERFSAAYKVQRGRMEGPTIERTNTFITGNGNVAWATYQWDFRAMVEGQPSAWRGHTSLVLEKRNGVWLIVLNHTSLVSEGSPKPQPATPPGKSPSGPGA
jgi:ketosteroid isomerase-like protein